MLARASYPAGVPCWIDLIQGDPDRTQSFYSDLFGWSFEVRTPPESPFTYAYARLDGQTVGGVGGPLGDVDPIGWTAYVSVESVDASLEVVTANGGKVTSGPNDIPGSGRVAVVADPHGAAIGLWQPTGLHGAELVNGPGSWNFNELHTPDPDASIAFYAAVFGWECDRFDLGEGQAAWLFRMPGYGDFLAQREPDIRERQAEVQAPDGFADAVAWMEPFDASRSGEAASWTTTFAVGDADAANAKAVELGAEVVIPLFDTPYTRQSSVRDPQGAFLTLSEFRPPDA